jgi:hypothetical protein
MRRQAVGLLIALSLSAQKPPIDMAKLLSDIDASYYHADDLVGLDCGVALDFGSVLKQMGQQDPSAAMKVLSAVTIKVHAVRGENTKIDIAGFDQAFPGRESIESGFRQMFAGFFQMYWSLAGPFVPADESAKFQVEARAKGGHILRANTNGTGMTLEIDGDNVPAKAMVDTAAMKVGMEMRFAPPKDPKPGDLRRLSSIDFSQHVGTTDMNGRIAMDYQTVDGIHIPRQVSMGIGGALTVSAEFTGCSVTRK